MLTYECHRIVKHRIPRIAASHRTSVVKSVQLPLFISKLKVLFIIHLLFSEFKNRGGNKGGKWVLKRGRWDSSDTKSIIFFCHWKPPESIGILRIQQIPSFLSSIQVKTNAKTKIIWPRPFPRTYYDRQPRSALFTVAERMHIRYNLHGYFYFWKCSEYRFQCNPPFGARTLSSHGKIWLPSNKAISCNHGGFTVLS